MPSDLVLKRIGAPRPRPLRLQATVAASNSFVRCCDTLLEEAVGLA